MSDILRAETTGDLITLSKDLRDTWQGKVLGAARGRMMLAVSSMLAHAYDETMAVLFRVIRPLCWDPVQETLRAPFLCSAAKIDKGGRIVADAILYDGAIKAKDKVIFASTRDLEYELRQIADATRLSDHERIEFFAVAKRWVVADRRLDPNMDPRDPDAKRLVH